MESSSDQTRKEANKIARDLTECQFVLAYPERFDRDLVRQARADHGWLVRLDRLASSLSSLEAERDAAFVRAEAQAVWRSVPEIAKALDELDQYTSMLSQGYAHSKAEMSDELKTVLRLAGSVSMRVRSQFRAALVSAGSQEENAAPPSPDTCANCGHGKSLHFDPNAYIPGKCNFQYDLCGCRDYVPAGSSDTGTGEQ